ncbi:SDR family oxidoreductase [Maritalea sp.]|uniref:SDR family oxidoreductase n=1 Tax=Maritalea sp. TaxID=2003361 RepID=UPI003EFAE4F2
MERESQLKLLIFGMGYSGKAIAKKWTGAVVGTTRSATKQEALKSEGLDAVLFDGQLSEELGHHIETATHIIISASPNAAGDPVLIAIPDFFDRVKALEWIGYLSTVGVYGDFDGAWISEKTPPQPVSERGKWRVKAEEQWREYTDQQDVAYAIFRLAGIYGPARSTFDKLRDGKSRCIVKPGQVFNRIHVDDIAQTLCAAANLRIEGVFNGADDEPAPPGIVIEHAAKMLGVDPPAKEPYETAKMTPMARSFYGDNKRCGNGRLKKDLGVTLLYPTYREGLNSILAKERE